MTQRSRNQIVDALVSSLKQIGGASYNMTLTTNVFRRFRLANEVSDGEFPIVFVTETGESSPIRTDERSLKQEIHVSVVGFVRERSTDPRVSTAATDAANLHDDIVKRLMIDSRLGILQVPLRIVESEVMGGADPVWGYCQLHVAMSYYHDGTDLGPSP